MNQTPSSPSTPFSRRDALRTLSAGAVALSAALISSRAAAADTPPKTSAGGATPPPAPTGPFTLPPLGFEYNALEPAIGQLTMELHHKRHHQAYVNNANVAVQNDPELHGKSAEELLRSMNTVPGSIRQAVRNNVGGHANHTLFWDILAPGGPKMPKGSIERKITSDLKSFEDMVRELSAAATGRFGSGWAWLSVYNKKLIVQSTANQDSPLMDGAVPVLGIDVWEHAYYLNYQNRRAEYVTALLGLINWDRVARRLDAAMAQAGSEQ